MILACVQLNAKKQLRKQRLADRLAQRRAALEAQNASTDCASDIVERALQEEEEQEISVIEREYESEKEEVERHMDKVDERFEQIRLLLETRQGWYDIYGNAHHNQKSPSKLQSERKAVTYGKNSL